MPSSSPRRRTPESLNRRIHVGADPPPCPSSSLFLYGVMCIHYKVCYELSNTHIVSNNEGSTKGFQHHVNNPHNVRVSLEREKTRDGATITGDGHPTDISSSIGPSSGWNSFASLTQPSLYSAHVAHHSSSKTRFPECAAERSRSSWPPGEHCLQCEQYVASSNQQASCTPN